MVGYRIISTRQLVRWLPVLVLLLAAYWRLDGLVEQSFWNDEGSTLRLIQRDLPDLIAAVKPDIHPPGYYLLLKGWTNFAGEHEFGLRSFSAFWGLLAVNFTYVLGARLYSRAAGILASGLVAINSLQVYYSQEARMYAQLGALTVISLYLLARLISTPPQTRQFGLLCAALGGINALGLYTHYTYPFTMVVQGIFFLWSERRSPRAFLLYAFANLMAVAVFALWLPTAYDQITRWPSDDSGVPLGEKLQTILTYISYGNAASDLGVMDFLWIAVLAGVLMLPDWYPKPPSNAWRVGLPLVWMILVCGALLFSGAYREANLKFLLPAQLALALLIGRGAYLLWDSGSGSAAVPLEMLPRLIAAAAFLVVISQSYGWLRELKTNPRFERDDYRAIARTIEANSRPPTAIILNGPSQQEVFTFYYKGNAPLFPLPRGLGGDDSATRAAVQDILANYRRIFVIFWGEGERDPNGVVKNTLDDNAFEIASQWFGNVRLVQYGVLEAPPTEPDHALAMQFGDHITLEGYAIRGRVEAGEVIGVTLFWQTDAHLETRYKVFVQLLNPDGFLVTQHDSEPANNRAMTIDWQPHQTVIDHHGILIPPDLATGSYTIIVGVYELDHPERRLAVQGGDSLTLERVKIE